jgi:hypothetical protein
MAKLQESRCKTDWIPKRFGHTTPPRQPEAAESEGASDGGTVRVESRDRGFEYSFGVLDLHPGDEVFRVPVQAFRFPGLMPLVNGRRKEPLFCSDRCFVLMSPEQAIGAVSVRDFGIVKDLP